MFNLPITCCAACIDCLPDLCITCSLLSALAFGPWIRLYEFWLWSAASKRRKRLMKRGDRQAARPTTTRDKQNTAAYIVSPGILPFDFFNLRSWPGIRQHPESRGRGHMLHFKLRHRQRHLADGSVRVYTRLCTTGPVIPGHVRLEGDTPTPWRSQHAPGQLWPAFTSHTA